MIPTASKSNSTGSNTGQEQTAPASRKQAEDLIRQMDEAPVALINRSFYFYVRPGSCTKTIAAKASTHPASSLAVSA